MIVELALVLLVAGSSRAVVAEAASPAAPAGEEASREQSLYTRGTAALDQRNWTAAAQAFAEVAALGGERADAALYWRAYALNKAGRKDEALQSLAALRAGYPRSKWVNDARALDLEIRQAAGQQTPVTAETGDDLKLIALGGLMNADPARAISLIRQTLATATSDKVRERALFVLAQSGTPEARTMLVDFARDGTHPATQAIAVRYLGLFGGQESRQALLDVYAGTENVDARKAVLQALMVAGDRARLAEIARQPNTPSELKREAINGLGVAGGRSELSQIYQQDTTVDTRKAVINALFVGGAVDQLTALATKETNPELRRDAIQHLGLMGPQTAPTLQNIYATDRDPAVKKAVLQAYFVQNNAAALIAIARQEQDPERKKDAVRMLSLMHSKEATDYMMELLK